MPVDCTIPEFWDKRYQANRTPWDMQGVPKALLEYLRDHRGKGRVLIPGCGSGYEVRAFREHGWETVAIDFAPAAVERATQALGAHGDAVRLGDFFANDVRGPFDLVYERTFLCSLPPDRWPDYARRMSELLRPDGRLIGLFVYGEESDPPPFPLTRTAAWTLFTPDFILAEDQGISVDQSLPIFAGKERWQVWRRRSHGQGA